ncbi:MAG: hypothetical protein GY810_09935 [Aureispira sp.]|nr:hypothetical protein [Aureispira sp.]
MKITLYLLLVLFFFFPKRGSAQSLKTIRFTNVVSDIYSFKEALETYQYYTSDKVIPSRYLLSAEEFKKTRELYHKRNPPKKRNFGEYFFNIETISSGRGILYDQLYFDHLKDHLKGLPDYISFSDLWKSLIDLYDKQFGSLHTNSNYKKIQNRPKFKEFKNIDTVVYPHFVKYYPVLYSRGNYSSPDVGLLFQKIATLYKYGYELYPADYDKGIATLKEQIQELAVGTSKNPENCPMTLVAEEEICFWEYAKCIVTRQRLETAFEDAFEQLEVADSSTFLAIRNTLLASVQDSQAMYKIIRGWQALSLPSYDWSRDATIKDPNFFLAKIKALDLKAILVGGLDNKSPCAILQSHNFQRFTEGFTFYRKRYIKYFSHLSRMGEYSNKVNHYASVEKTRDYIYYGLCFRYIGISKLYYKSDIETVLKKYSHDDDKTTITLAATYKALHEILLNEVISSFDTQASIWLKTTGQDRRYFQSKVITTIFSEEQLKLLELKLNQLFHNCD